MKLTSKDIEKLKPRAKRYSVAIGDGLTLRVHPTGRKSFLVRIAHGDKVKDITLGHYPEMTLMVAKQKARKLRQAHELPITSSGATLNYAFKLWCANKKGRIKSYASERQRLKNHVLDVIGSTSLDDISAPLVIAALKPLEKTGKLATLKRVRMRLREVLDIAVCAGLLDANPIARIHKVFQVPTVTPMPSIHWTQLGQALELLCHWSAHDRLLLLWSLCTLLRPGEAVAISKRWIDGDVLTIPAKHTKANRAFRLPLVDEHVAIIEAVSSLGIKPCSPFLFPSRRGHLSSQYLAKLMHASPISGRLVPHGIRALGRTWLAEHNVPFEIGEACLNHITTSTTARAYLRSDYLNQRRPIMKAWASFVLSCASCAGFLDGLPIASSFLSSQHTPFRPVLAQ